MKKLNVKEQQLVADAYLEHGYLVQRTATKYSRMNDHIEEGDLVSYLNEKFIEAVRRFDPTKGNLGGYLNTRLKQHALNFVGGEVGYANENLHCKFFSEYDNDNKTNSADGEIEPFAETLTKDKKHVIELEVEKRNLLNYLYDIASDVQRKIMNEYLIEGTKPTFTQIGGALNIHHMTVKRELEKLGKACGDKFDIDAILFA